MWLRISFFRELLLQLLSHLPTHGLTHKDRCQPIQSYSSLKSAAVPSQPQFVLSSVPRMSIIPRRQASGGPAQVMVFASTEQAWLYFSSRSRHSGLLLQTRAMAWQVGREDPPTSYPSSCCAQTGCRSDCARKHCSSGLGLFLKDWVSRRKCVIRPFFIQRQRRKNFAGRCYLLC